MLNLLGAAAVDVRSTCKLIIFKFIMYMCRKKFYMPFSFGNRFINYQQAFLTCTRDYSMTGVNYCSSTCLAVKSPVYFVLPTWFMAFLFKIQG